MTKEPKSPKPKKTIVRAPKEPAPPIVVPMIVDAPPARRKQGRPKGSKATPNGKGKGKKVHVIMSHSQPILPKPKAPPKKKPTASDHACCAIVLVALALWIWMN